METIRVLLVDDFAAWRKHLRSILKQRPGIEIVGEASDGSEAVRKARELNPDLILMDISLPRLNGIEAARHIKTLVPTARILFASQHTSADFVEAAIIAGGRGYLVKSDVGAELLAAINAVKRDGFYVSRHAIHTARRRNATAHPPAHKSTQPPHPEYACCHEVGFYSDDSVLLDSFTRFIADELERGGSVICVANAARREHLLLRLRASTLDLTSAIEQGRYVPIDPSEALSTFMVNGMPDSGLFARSFGDLLGSVTKAATAGYPYVSACGECPTHLLEQGNTEAAVRLEQLWDRFARAHGMRVLCGYPLITFRRKEYDQVLQEVCAAHSSMHFH